MTKQSAVLLSCAVLWSLSACTTKDAAPTSDSAAVAAVATPTSATATTDQAQVRAAIEALNQKTTVAILAQDAVGAVQNYADSAMSLVPGMPIMRGLPAIQQGMQGMFDAMKVDAATFSTQDVMVSGDFAVESGTFEMTMTPKVGKPVQDKGKYLAVWQHQADGSWRIIRDTYNLDVAPPG